MSAPHRLLWEALFWGSIFLVGYTYLLYPVLMWALAKASGPAKAPQAGGGPPPKVSLLIAAYNEASVIEEKLVNCLGQGYPKDRLEVLVGSDGSQDTTAALASRSGAGGPVRVFDFPRRGKSWVVNDLARAAAGDILVFSDANTIFAPDALERLVRPFRDPAIGCVSGLLVLRKKGEHMGAAGEGFYWRYETFKKRQENAFRAVAGANGAIYAVRRELFVPLTPRAINDDFTISMSVYLQGRRIALADDALAYEWTAPDFQGEFRRHVRDSAGHFQAMWDLRGLLNPLIGMPSFCYVSHRVIRWLVPLFMASALLGALALMDSPFYRLATAVQASAYVGAALMTPAVVRGRRFGLLFVPYYFMAVNAAIAVGFAKFCLRRQSSMWERTERAEAGATGPRQA